MAKLTENDRFIINALFDRSVFTSSYQPGITRANRAAITSLQTPSGQQRVINYCKTLLGLAPENFQENLLLLVGTDYLRPVAVHVLLATLKAIINAPELQAGSGDRAVAAQTVVRQVHSVVAEVDEKEIRRLITRLFVDRFGLFTPDQLASTPTDTPAEVAEYWEVSPDFNVFAQNVVNYLDHARRNEALTAVQRVNRVLLTQTFLSPASDPAVWPLLAANKTAIADLWAQSGRFNLEVGNGYALLLDTQHTPSVAMPYLVALAVAHELGTGVQDSGLTQKIKAAAHRLYPTNAVPPSVVKQALRDTGLIEFRDGYAVPTPLVARFTVQQGEDKS
ncbi:hypothetical protein [Schleiferilactobacillus shenzhenensis]|uniref:Uncharacterized protein n=1 Tax=Schleiferilactobacillus shenzhenensis LY-73 TaxID=1231336 RepID=U4TR63_9LACO|nr:hypothetical protein [Schleiferilactobacillus shenzhenensis]ERL65945.1 hypothetical protein L248_2021 [Schleiferilactobacillus shenzhenensis LY-73]